MPGFVPHSVDYWNHVHNRRGSINDCNLTFLTTCIQQHAETVLSIDLKD